MKLALRMTGLARWRWLELTMLVVAAAAFARLIAAVREAVELRAPRSSSRPGASTRVGGGERPALDGEKLERLLGLAAGSPTSRPDGRAQPPPEELRLRLWGTARASVSEWSLAVVEELTTHRTEAVRLHGILLGAEVVAIERDRLLLRRGREESWLRMGPGEPATRPLTPQAAGGPEAEIQALPGGEVRIARGLMERALLGDPALLAQARVIPELRGGAWVGLRLAWLQPGSPYARLGLQSGDVLRSVDGVALDSPAHALELLGRLRGASRVELRLERGGAELTRRFTIE